MRKNELVQLQIEDMSDEGLGIGHADGMALFVKDTVIGDTVRAKIVKVKKNYAFARVEEVLEPSADRTDPLCPVARACGGCQIQEMDYAAQLRMKEQKVRGNLIRIGGFHPDEDLDEETFLPIVGMEEPWKYRNKAQFPIGTGRDGKPVAGFYAGRTHSIIDNHRCVIGIDENEYVLEAVMEWMRSCHVSAYDESAGSGVIRHVMTRAGFATGQLMVVIVAAADRLPAEDLLVEALQRAADRGRYTLASVVLNCNRGRTNVILGNCGRVLYGSDSIEDRIGDLTYKISSRSFYQVNPAQTRVLYETALKYAGLTGKETVWDLYCGTGTISLFLARKAGRVIGVEVIPEAIENAKENAARNHIDNCRFIVGKAEDVVDSLEPADVIVVDPPRKGLDRVVVDTILRSAPSRIVYVSCDSATLARDLRLLDAGGYRLMKVQPVDMFPHTVHVETCVLLVRESISDDEMVSIKVDLDGIALDQGRYVPPEKPTYKNIKQWISDKYGFNVSTLYIAQIKDKVGMEKRKNYNPGSGEGRVPVCPPEKEEAIMDAFRHFDLI